MARNLLLGKGENLVTHLPPPKKGGPKIDPYTNPEEVYGRLGPQLSETWECLDALDHIYCPGEQAVFKMDLHPAYIAKSYFPQKLLNRFSLKVVGSRRIHLTPSKVTGIEPPKETSTHRLYVSGIRTDIQEFTRGFTRSDLFDEVKKVERISAFQPGERIMGNLESLAGCKTFELVLHSESYDESIINAFAELAAEKGVILVAEKRIQTSGLCFIPIHVNDITELVDIEPFSFLRVVRKMPRLRRIVTNADMKPFEAPIPALIPCPDIERKVAVFDVGCDTSPWLNGWVRRVPLERRYGGPDEILHGTMVNSALLFGDYSGQRELMPVAAIDSYQVLDPADKSGDFELYEALNRICQVLDTNDYEFVNLSLGPDLPIEDDEVHVWTSKLDEKLADGKTLMTVAVGNNGALDRESGNARIEVPADSVNALSVGASTASGENAQWDRTSYSAIGPGRASSLHKPDVLDFGGCRNSPFKIVGNDGRGCFNQAGTSFASPNALRKCIALKRRYPELRPLALKALMIHSASKKADSEHDMSLHGHGALPDDLDHYVVCGDGEMTIVYQGQLDSSKFVKALIPVPDSLCGMITLKATLCYSSEVNPQTPENYTRCGLEVLLRPNSLRETKDEERPKSRTFFDHSEYESEENLQRQGLKWNTVLQGEQRLSADKSIDKPFFEIHCISRDGIGNDPQPRAVPYALVVTIQAPKHPTIYDEVISAYADKIRPIVEAQVNVPAEIHV